MRLTKEKGKYYITNEKRLCKRGCVLEELTLKDLEKIQILIEKIFYYRMTNYKNKQEKKRWKEVKKHKRLIVGNIKRNG